MRSLALFLVLVVVSLLALTAWTYAAHLAAVTLFPPVSPRPLGEMVICAVVGALAAAAVASGPVVFLFRKAAWRVAFFVAGPMLFIRVPDLLSASGPLGRQTHGTALFEITTYVAALVIGALVTSNLWRGSNSSFQRTASGGR